LGAGKDVQNGIYVSVINKRNPKDHQFVLLPELINGTESNFIGAMAYAKLDPKVVSERLMAVLERVKGHGLEFTYFTARLSQSQLQRIEEAEVTLGHHGESEEAYAEAHEVLDRLDKKTGLFTVLEYKLDDDPRAARGALHIDRLKFSFDPGGK